MTTYQEISAQFYSNRLLFGDPADPGVVAVEIASRTEIDVFKRLAGALTCERRPLQLFVLVEDAALMNGFKAPHQTRELAGDFRYRILVTFESVDTLEAGKRHLRQSTGKPASAPDAPYFVLGDPVEQHLMLSGTTFFMGLDFGPAAPAARYRDLHQRRASSFRRPAREGDRVIAISITDSTGFERVLSGHEMDERAMLEELVESSRERDPDVIEGHNLFRFDLEYLEERARRHK